MPTFKSFTYAYNKDPLHVTVSELKHPKADEVLIKVSAASLNPVDIVLYNLAYYITSFWNNKQGVGRDYSGTVEAVGAQTAQSSGLKVGDHVYGLYSHPLGKGTIAEYVTIKPDGLDCTVSKIPAGLSKEEAAAIPLVFGTANQMMEGHQIRGSKVLILGGATSVGRYLIQLARVKGAAEIVTTNGGRSNDLVQLLGSTKQIDYHEFPNLLTPVLESARNGKFNYIYDCAGNNDLFGHMGQIIAPKPNGYVSIVGDRHIHHLQDDLVSLFWANRALAVRAIRLQLGLLPYTYKYDLLKPGKWLDYATSLYEQGQLQVFVDSTCSFADTPNAFNKVGLGKASGKVVIQIEK